MLALCRRCLSSASLPPGEARARTFAILHERAHAEVTTEIDDTNAPSTALLVEFGARRTGGSIELVRRGEPPSPVDSS